MDALRREPKRERGAVSAVASPRLRQIWLWLCSSGSDALTRPRCCCPLLLIVVDRSARSSAHRPRLRCLSTALLCSALLVCCSALTALLSTAPSATPLETRMEQEEGGEREGREEKGETRGRCDLALTSFDRPNEAHAARIQHRGNTML